MAVPPQHSVAAATREDGEITSRRLHIIDGGAPKEGRRLGAEADGVTGPDRLTPPRFVMTRRSDSHAVSVDPKRDSVRFSVRSAARAAR
jgi:hypothetical protein